MTQFLSLFYWFSLTLGIGSLMGCGPRFSSRASEYFATANESLECLTNFSYDSSIALVGEAQFQKRGLDPIIESNKLKSMLLSDPLPSALPIKYAEVVVYNSDNEIVQCGLTDASGNLKAVDGTSDLLVPNAPQSFLVRVLARTNIPFSGSSINLNASVKKDVYHNEVYALETSVFSDGENSPVISLVAKARQTDSNEVEGGAFNILNDLFHAYQFIAANTTGVDATCLNEKVNVFWRAGFNPYQYILPSADPDTLENTSFYSREQKKIFITGGRVGDMSFENTDHFDDFAVIHELGHFIEDQCGEFTSAGGSHAVIVRIDPRLAWSEGWSNYFAAQVLNAKLSSIDPTMGTKLLNIGEASGWTFFFNSYGFSDSFQNIGNGQGALIDFKKPGTNPGEWPTGTFSGLAFDQVNPTNYPGEGHFREGAVSRGLFKITNNCGTSCVSTTPVTFADIWRSMSTLTGMGSSGNPFLSSSSFLEILKSRVTWADYKATAESEALHLYSDGGFTAAGISRWIPFGHKLVYSGSPCANAMYIQPRTDDPVLTNSSSDQRYSNHFYTVDLASLPVGLNQISVTFSYVTGTNSVDHDLILFKELYSFNDDYVCSVAIVDGKCSGTWSGQKTTNSTIVKSNRTIGSNLSASYTKSISGLAQLDPEPFYLLDLRAYTANKSIGSTTEYSYTMTSNLGGYLCPQ